MPTPPSQVSTKTSSVDAVRELRLRQWARLNFVNAEKRPRLWHPIVLEEMGKMDQELAREQPAGKIYAIDAPHEHVPHEELWARATSMTRYEPMESLNAKLPTELFFG